MAEWKGYVGNVEPDTLVFSTNVGTPILPKQRLASLHLPSLHTAGTSSSDFIDVPRTYSSWSHDRGVPGKVVTQLMGHANVDTTLNVYTQVLDGRSAKAVWR